MPECFLYEAVLIFLQYGIPRWLPFVVTKNITEHENDPLMDFDQVCVKMILAMSSFKIK